MDKIKEQLAVVLKHGFWIGCSLAALLAVGAWYHATGTLATETKKQYDNIKAKAGAVKTIANDQTPHPNQTSLKGMDELNKLVAQDVRDGWKKVYDLQREVLVWPDEFDPKFHKAVDNLRPIEIVPFPTPPEKEINPDFHRIYRDYILNVVPMLAKTVGTEWKAVRQASGSGSGASADFSSSAFSSSSYPMAGTSESAMGAKKLEDKSLVHWSPANQQEIQNSHFGFAGRADPPKTLEILYAQEDLWVLHSLTEIIRSTNKGAEFYHESSIKDIDYIRIGKNAGGVSGQITWVTAAADSSGYNATSTGDNAGGRRKSGGESTMGSGSMNPMMMPMSGTMGATAVSVDPAQFRYVDANYKPLEAKKVRDVITNSVVSEADAVLAVAKRMPVRMRVVMDQRKLPLLITECANSRLPVEVKQVRINRPAGSSGASGGSGGYSSLPMGDASGGYSQFTSPGGGGGSRVALGPDPNNVTVEVFGIIYIYNPPNDAQLGLENLNRTAGNSTPPANLAAR